MRSLLTLVVLALAATLVLFEALFLDASFLGLDNRMAPPFVIHRDPDEPPRAMNFATSDINGFVIPSAMLQRERLLDGEWPLWNPYQNGGQPLLADMGLATVYPTTALYLAIPVLRAYAVSLLVHLVFLGFGTYLLLRRRGFGTSGALFGGVALALCGFVGVHLHLPNFLRAMAWLPWILWSADRLRDRPGARRGAVLAAAVGGCLLAGFPQVSLLALYSATADFLWRLPRARRRGRTLGLAALALALGGMLGSIHLVPGMELHRESWRSGGLSAEQWDAKSLSPVTLVGLVLPHFFGSPVQEYAPGHPVHDLRSFPSAARWLDVDVQNNFVENTTYAGLVPLALVLLVLTRRRRPGEWLAWTLLVLSLLLALGTPLVADLGRLLPGVGAGSPKRVLFLAALALVLLAASELDRLVRDPTPGDRRRLVGMGSGLFGLGLVALLPWQHWLFAGEPAELLGWFRTTLTGDAVTLLVVGLGVIVCGWRITRSRRTAALLLIGLTAVDLAWFARQANPVQTLDDQYQTTPVVDWLQEEGAGDRWRFITYHDDPALAGSVAQVFHLRAANGLAAMLDRETGEILDAVDPAVLDEWDPRNVGSVKDPAALRSPLLDLLGVRHVVTSVEGFLDLQGRLAEMPGLTLAYRSEEELIAVYQRPSALPPAFAVTRLREIPGLADRLTHMAADDFEPAVEAVVESIPPSLRGQDLSPATVQVVRPRPERFEIQVTADGPAFLVVSETHQRGWHATVDGEEVPVMVADHAFLGVPVPAGTHEVEVEYRPGSFRLGLLLFGVGAVVLTLMLVWPRRG